MKSSTYLGDNLLPRSRWGLRLRTRRSSLLRVVYNSFFPSRLSTDTIRLAPPLPLRRRPLLPLSCLSVLRPIVFPLPPLSGVAIRQYNTLIIIIIIIIMCPLRRNIKKKSADFNTFKPVIRPLLYKLG